MQTTLTAEGTATRGFVKCFWASKKPRAELCIKQNTTFLSTIVIGLALRTRTVKLVKAVLKLQYRL